MEILVAPNPLLNIECRSDFDVSFTQIEQMFALMRKHNGIGLAAPQVGIDARLFVTDWGQVFINPVIRRRSDKLAFAREGCLSLPGEFWVMGRWTWIEMSTGEVFEGLKARCIQHEIDHLDGMLINS